MQQRWGLVTLCLAVLVAQVDTAVVNLATHAIAAHFQAGLGAMQWFVDSYNLVYAVLLLTGGLLADRCGRRRVFRAGVAVFGVASLLCAMAPSMAWLIAGRALAGVGAALLLPASLAIIRVGWVEPAQRNRALGIWAACNGLAMAVGPSLGGALLHWYGWPSIFLAVIPLCALALALSYLFLLESIDPQHRPRDVPAQLLAAVALACLALSAIELRESTAVALGALLVAVGAVLAFVRLERRRGETALVPLLLLTAPVFAAAMLAATAMTFGMYGVLFLLPLWWLGSGVFSSVQAGMALMPMALVFVVVSPSTGYLAARWSTRAVAMLGLALIACGLWTIACLAASPHMAGLLVGLGITGLGMGLATGPLMGMAIGAVSAARSGIAGALINVARMVGATLGVAILGAVFAAAGGGVSGLRAAMGLGGLVQCLCAAVAWRMTRGSSIRNG